MKDKLLLLLAISMLSLSSYILGARLNQKEIENRALTMNKECYTGLDLGFIIKNIQQP